LPSGRSVSSSTLSLHDERLVTYHAEASGQAFAKSGSTADTAAGGPLDGVMVAILNADKRDGTHVFTTVAQRHGPALNCGHD
jgi:hypothetical protein